MLKPIQKRQGRPHSIAILDSDPRGVVFRSEAVHDLKPYARGRFVDGDGQDTLDHQEYVLDHQGSEN
jgi:hypothetical protein